MAGQRNLSTAEELMNNRHHFQPINDGIRGYQPNFRTDSYDEN